MRKEKVLTLKECYGILNRYKAPNTVLKHSEGVAKVCYLIGKKYRENRKKIDLPLLVNAALLHDLFKIIEIDDYSKYQTAEEVRQKEKFWDKLKQIFAGKGHEDAFVVEFGKKYPKISNLVFKHKYVQINKGFGLEEERILYYADKIVKFDKITTLKDRLLDARNRYAHKYKSRERKKFIKETNKKIVSLEKEIFKTSGLSQKDLEELNNISLKELMEKKE